MGNQGEVRTTSTPTLSESSHTSMTRPTVPLQWQHRRLVPNNSWSRQRFLGHPPSSSYFPRKATCSSARTTERSPVTRHQSPSKVMLKILLSRLKPQEEKIIAEEQAGFRAGRGTTEQIFNLRILGKKCLQHQQDLYHVFINFKKAFNRVWHAA